MFHIYNSILDDIMIEELFFAIHWNFLRLDRSLNYHHWTGNTNFLCRFCAHRCLLLVDSGTVCVIDQQLMK